MNYHYEDDGIVAYTYEGVKYSWITSEELYRRFNAGVSLEELAKARDCSIARVKSIIKKQRDDAARISTNETIRDLVQFDKRLVKLDPSGSSAVTMAYLQPMRKFLEQIK